MTDLGKRGELHAGFGVAGLDPVAHVAHLDMLPTVAHDGERILADACIISSGTVTYDYEMAASVGRARN